MCFVLFSGGQHPLMMREDRTFCMRRVRLFVGVAFENTGRCGVRLLRAHGSTPQFCSKKIGQTRHPAAAELPPRLFETFPHQRETFLSLSQVFRVFGRRANKRQFHVSLGGSGAGCSSYGTYHLAKLSTQAPTPHPLHRPTKRTPRFRHHCFTEK